MHDLLPFVPRPRTKIAATDTMKKTLSVLIDDIQVIANCNRQIVINVIAQLAHEQRIRVQREERQHGRL